MELKIKSTLVWLIMAGLCGLIGFTIIYHYASYERPVKHFAIVIDAGSTQTRSGLFTINVDTPELARWTNEVLEADSNDNDGDLKGQPKTPLSKILEVRQVSSCVNGGPLAALPDQASARKIVLKCLAKFVDHIKRLDFIENPTVTTFSVQPSSHNNQTTLSETTVVNGVDDNKADSEEINKQMAMLNHRLNSVTHLYLGATAGMRSLDKINHQAAVDRLAWISKAINESSTQQLTKDGGASPYINRGFVGIIKGSDEAAFGWLSVNFVCDQLIPQPSPMGGAQINEVHTTDGSQAPVAELNNLVYDIDTYQLHKIPANLNESSSVGILELGGASAQMAFRAPKEMTEIQILNSSLFEKNVELFNGHYRLATRSDLCLGMSQAVLRVNYIVLRQLFSTMSALPTPAGQIFDVENACMQSGSELKLTGQQLNDIWQGACLLSSSADPLANQFKLKFMSNLIINFKGTGDVDKCNQLLDNLIEPNRCNQYFSLCPSGKNKQPPPSGMPFVTISGYNHALNVLELTPKQVIQDNNINDKWRELEFTIEDKLGGSSVDYWEFINKTREYCSTPLASLKINYPKVSKQYQSIICMQLIYIKKLLTQFYHFDATPASTSGAWDQIKFLLFTPRSQALPTVAGKKVDVRRDIGWTLGLLLNATSEQLSGSGDPSGATVFFHHGASVMFVMRATIFMMFACCLLAIALLVVGVIEVRRAQRSGAAYINHINSSAPSSTYEVSSSEVAAVVATPSEPSVNSHNSQGKSIINTKPLRSVLVID